MQNQINNAEKFILIYLCLETFLVFLNFKLSQHHMYALFELLLLVMLKIYV